MHIALAILAFSALVIIHELGHFLVARWSGMRVDKFSVGFGPVIFATRRGETEYRISALPLGGYVSIAGMDPSDPHSDDPKSYATKPVWKRLATIAAGPSMNYLFAFVLATCLFALSGRDTPDRSSTVIATVSPDGPARAAGVLAGDKLLAIDHRPVASFDEIVEGIRKKGGTPVTLTLQRADAQTEVSLVPVQSGERAMIGIGPPSIQVPMSWGEAIPAGAEFVWKQNAAIVTSLAAMITLREKPQLSGPLGIAQVMTEQARRGMVWLLRISAVLSVALALFNFLPLPALDGGRLVFLGLEVLLRRPVNQRIEQAVHAVGLILLLGLILLVTVGDIGRIFGK